MVIRNVTPDIANAMPSTVQELEFLGSFYRATLHTQGPDPTTFRVDCSINLMRDLGIKEGGEVTVALPADHIRVYRKTFAHPNDMA